jgi:hypothetical protein
MECRVRKLTKIGTPKLPHPGSGIGGQEVEDDEVDPHTYIYIYGGPDIKVGVRNSGVTFRGLIIGGGVELYRDFDRDFGFTGISLEMPASVMIILVGDYDQL